MDTVQTDIVNDGITKLRNMQIKYKEFVNKAREQFLNHRTHIDQLEGLVKQIDVDPAALKNVNAVTIPLVDWKVYWEGVMRFSQVMGISTGKASRGELVDLKSMFTKDILSTLGITEFSYIPQGKWMYVKLHVTQEEKYLNKLVGESRPISDWDKLLYLNQRLSINRMIDLMKLVFWDEIGNILETNIKYMSVNMKKEKDLTDFTNRFYMCITLIEFGILFYNSTFNLMLHYIRTGTALVEARK